VAVAVARGRRLQRAWDLYLLPWPFTRAVVLVGEPLRPGPADEPEGLRLILEARLQSLDAEARRLLG